MKRIICLLLCVAMLTLAGCAAKEGPVGENTLLKDEGKTLKLLAITSSFGVNTTEYLYDIATAQGCTDVVVGRLYFGACTLKRHVNNANTNNPEYTYYKNNSGEWITTEGVSMLEGLQDEDWDIIFIQQSAAKAALVESYEDYIDQLITYVNANKTKPDAKFIWNMTWAYQGDSQQEVFVENFGSDQMAMYQAIVDTTKEKVVPRDDIAAIIPSGTAIQNARTSYFGDILTEDTYHLSDLGKVIAGYTLYAVLADKPLEAINFTQVTDSFALSDSNKEVIIDAVNNAVKTPFEVTQSAYPD